MACEEKRVHHLCLQAGLELGRRHEIVLDRITGSNHRELLQPRDGSEKLRLHFLGQAGGHSLNVDAVCLPTLLLKEYVMPLLMGKLHKLVFDRGAVTRPNAGNTTAVHCRPVQVAHDYLPRRLRCIGQPAREQIFARPRRRHIRECERPIVRPLLLHL